MTDITELPPSPEPKKETVKVRSRTLKEHFEAFLNKNNLSGWVSDTDNELGKDTVGGILLEVMTSPGMTKDQINQTAHRVRELTRGHLVDMRFSSINLNEAKHFIYSALGYPTEQSLQTFLAGGYNGDIDEKIFNKPIASNLEIPSMDLDESIVESKHATRSIISNKPLERTDYFNKKVKALSRPSLTISHYLFARFGVVDAFKIFADTEVAVINNADTAGVGEDHTLIRSVFIPIGIAIPKAKINNLTMRMAAGFLRDVEENLSRHRHVDVDELTTSSLWRLWMGEFIGGEDQIDSANEHLESLDDFITDDDRKQLGVDNIYQLMASMLSDFENYQLRQSA